MPEKSYVSLLEDELLLRKKKNHLYSLRAFAQHLGLSAAYISLIFSGKRHPSLNTAAKIAKKLSWSRSKQKYFVNLLEFENPKTEESKEVAINKIQKLGSSELKFNSLDVDIFSAISAWHYNAILSLLTIKKVKATIPFISKKLKLDGLEIRNAMQRLGLVKSKGNYWIAIHDYLRVKSTPSEAVRIYHKQLLTMAAKAIDEQDFETRDFSNITLTVDRNQIQAAKNKIVKFQSEMAQLLEGHNPTEVYQLSVQLFCLSQNLEN